MKIVSVVGARPQFVKLAPIAHEASRRDIEHVIVHSGQHYDEMMSSNFFDELNIPAPDYNLSVGSGNHGEQTSAIIAALEPIFLAEMPDWVLVYGDTNTTLAAAIVAVKLHIPLAHLESGLRSFNRKMPEEHNRVLTDHAADLCLAPTALAMENLRHEGLENRSVLVGDVMTDVLLQTVEKIKRNSTFGLDETDFPDASYFVSTIHRAENTDDATRLRMLIASLAASPLPVLLLAHPRLQKKASEFGISLNQGSIRVSGPLAYPELLSAVLRSAGVITDSGGLQKEAFLLGVKCTTLRTESEWPETFTSNWNMLANTPEEIAAAITRPTDRAARETPYGDGNAARHVLDALTS